MPASTKAGSTATRSCWPGPASARSTRHWSPPSWPTVSAARAIVFSGVAGGLDPDLAYRRRGDRRPHAPARCRRDRGRAPAHLPGRPRPLLQPDRPAGLPGRPRSPGPRQGAPGRLRPAAALQGRRRPRPAAPDRLRHHPLGRPVPPLRGDPRPPPPRARRPGDRDGRRCARARSARPSASPGSTSAPSPTSPAATPASTSWPSSTRWRPARPASCGRSCRCCEGRCSAPAYRRALQLRRQPIPAAHWR